MEGAADTRQKVQFWCRTCGRFLEAVRAGCPDRGGRPECRSCWLVEKQMNQHCLHIEDMELELEYQKDFYVKIAQRRDTQQGTVKFQEVQETLQTMLVAQRTRSQEKIRKKPWRPLDRWAAKGYDSDMIQKNAESKQHPILGTIYGVDLETDKHKDVRSWAIRLISTRIAKRKKKKDEARKTTWCSECVCCRQYLLAGNKLTAVQALCQQGRLPPRVLARTCVAPGHKRKVSKTSTELQ